MILPLCSPTGNGWEFQFFCMLTNTWWGPSFNSAILAGVWLYFNVVSICISLISDDVEHLFMCWLAFPSFLWWRVCSNLFVPPSYFYRVVSFFIIELQEFSYSLNTGCMLWIYVFKCFLQSVAYFFIFLTVYFKEQFVFLLNPIYEFFPLWFVFFITYLKIFAWPKRFFPYFPLEFL